VTAGDPGRPREGTVLTPPSAVSNGREKISKMDLRMAQVLFYHENDLRENKAATWRLVTLRSSSEMYCSFLTRDL